MAKEGLGGREGVMAYGFATELLLLREIMGDMNE